MPVWSARTRRRLAVHALNRQAASGHFSLLMVLFIAVTLFAGLQPQAASASSAWIDTDVLNLRDGPGVWADVIEKMWQDEPVQILDGPTSDGWYQLNHNGSVGWAHGGYIWMGNGYGWDPPAGGGSSGGGGGGGASTGAWYEQSAWVDTDRLKLRSWASSSADVMSVLGTGEEVWVSGYAENGYVPVYDGGVYGYLWLGYLSFSQIATAGPEHWIDIDRSSEMVTLYVGNEAIASYWAAMGFDQSNYGFYATAIGSYVVYGKNANLNWTTWGQAYIKYWVAFDPERKNGFHSYSMDSDGNVLTKGSGPTGGCVATAPAAAREIFNFSYEGMRVEIHW